MWLMVRTKSDKLVPTLLGHFGKTLPTGTLLVKNLIFRRNQFMSLTTPAQEPSKANHAMA
jgi:hypothetical protein